MMYRAMVLPTVVGVRRAANPVRVGGRYPHQIAELVFVVIGPIRTCPLIRRQ